MIEVAQNYEHGVSQSFKHSDKSGITVMYDEHNLFYSGTETLVSFC